MRANAQTAGHTRAELVQKGMDPRKATKASWRLKAPINNDMRWALQQVRYALQRPIAVQCRPPLDQVHLFTDASDQGWGGFTSATANPSPSAESILSQTSRAWSAQERQKPASHREAIGSARAALELSVGLNQVSLVIHSDCRAVVAAWQKGTGKPGLNWPILQVKKVLIQRGVVPSSQWVEGCKNSMADLLSRKIDHQSYQLLPHIFQSVQKKLGIQMSVDAFASQQNHQLPRWFSVNDDALQKDWAVETPWLNPPWHLIPAVLRKIQEEKVQGVICVPKWPRKWWWAQLMELKVGQPLRIQRSKAVQRAKGRHPTASQVGPLYLPSSGDLSVDMKNLIHMTDVRPTLRLKWAQKMQQQNLAPAALCVKTIRALRRQTKAPRYSVPLPLMGIVQGLQTLVRSRVNLLPLSALLSATAFPTNIIARIAMATFRIIDLLHNHRGRGLLQGAGAVEGGGASYGLTGHFSSLAATARRTLGFGSAARIAQTPNSSALRLRRSRSSGGAANFCSLASRGGHPFCTA